MRSTARALLAVACVLAAQGGLAQDTARVAQPRDTARPVQRGVLTGTITDTAGRPLTGADIIVSGTRLRTRSRADGQFVLAGIPAGDAEVVFRKLGYDPADVALNVVANTQVSVAVKLAPIAQRLEGVTINASVFNELGGLVVDAAGQPVSGAEVAIEGSGRSARAREDGAFLFLPVS